jgi:hypothetical protein
MASFMAYGSRDRCDAVPTTRLVHAGDLVVVRLGSGWHSASRSMSNCC